MEEEKAAAYYDDVARKGEGAARFKQGLGFTSPSSRDSSTSFSSSLLTFVRASSPSKVSEFQRQKQLQNIHNKLHKKSFTDTTGCSSFRQNLYSGKDGYDERRSRRRRRSRSMSGSDEDGCRTRGKSRVCLNESPFLKFMPDYSRLIRGYGKMSSAERLRARLKFELNKTAKKDTNIGKGSGWERFEFDKDAPLDDQEMEVVEDDKLLVQKIGQSFRLCAIEARKAEDINSAHDQAIFGAPIGSTQADDSEEEVKERPSPVIERPSLFSDKVLATRGSWRDRAENGGAA